MTEIELIEQLFDDLCPFVAERRSDPTALEVSTKSNPADFVTEMDTAVQERIVAAIGEAFPDDRVVGEESGMNDFPPMPAPGAGSSTPSTARQTSCGGTCRPLVFPSASPRGAR